MTNAVLLKMTFCFGSSLAVLLLLLRLLVEHTITPTNIAVVAVGCWAGFFLAYKFTFAIFWNRRARRLRNSEAHTNAKV